jgi:antirestriction protein ArdC
VIDPIQRIQHAETFFANLKADIRHGGNRAYYATGTDHVQMPPFEAFRDAESFYGTLAHECCHWSGAKSRLARDLSGRFGSHAYAMDELISEICSAFLCADLALTPEPREDHAAYLASWLTILKNDRRAIFTAAAHAERAAAFLHAKQPQAAMSDGEGHMAA